MKKYTLTDKDGTNVLMEGTAQDILDALLRHNTKFVDEDGSRLFISPI